MGNDIVGIIVAVIAVAIVAGTVVFHVLKKRRDARAVAEGKKPSGGCGGCCSSCPYEHGCNGNDIEK